MGCATRPTRGFGMNSAPALVVDNLTTEFRIEGRWHAAIRNVSFTVGRHETLALVGESGCGKSITALSIMQLVPRANGRIAAGRVLLDGRDLVQLEERELEATRGGAISTICQEAMIFITHNLGVVASIADRVAVMYAGDIVETASVATLFERPTHPYTEALLSSIPRVDRDAGALKPIAGQVPPITAMPAGCRYADRCPLRIARCATMPPLVPLAGSPEHEVRCWVRAGDGSATA